MEYTKDTKLSDIKNAQNIADSTKKAIDVLLTKNLDFFVKFDETTQEYSIKTESLSTICGTSSGAIANQIKKRKGNIFEKLGDFFDTWSKDNGKLSTAEIAAQSEQKARFDMAKKMLDSKMDVKQIATFTGLNEEEINALKA